MTAFEHLQSWIKPWRSRYIFSGLLLILTSFLRMLEPQILQMAIDATTQVIQQGWIGNPIFKNGITTYLGTLLPLASSFSWWLVSLAGLFLCLSLIRAAAQLYGDAINAASTEKAIKQLRDRLFRHLQYLPLSYYDTHNSADIIQRCTGDIDTVRKFYAEQLAQIVRFSAIFVGAVVLMVGIDPLYTVIALCLVPVSLISSYYFFQYEKKVWDEHEAEQDKLTEIINENLNGIRVVQTFANEAIEIARFIAQNKRKRAIGLRQMRLHQNFWAFSDGLIFLQATISLGVGAYFTLIHRLSLGEFAGMLSYSVAVAWPLRQVGQLVSQMGMAFVATERIALIFDATEEKYEGVLSDSPIQGDIIFDNVSFSYPNEEKKVLNGISFCIKKGEKVAIIGSTGSGKSTIAALLLRLYPISAGEIHINNAPIQSLHPHYLRRRIGLVSQKAFLYSTSVKANIAYSRSEVSTNDIDAAAGIASVHHFLPILEKGYDTVVGEKGVSLSGGQRQRVALARTILQNPDVLILDDTTSAVDTETEQHIWDAVKTSLKEKTVIIIAHRLAALQFVDKIIVLENGCIIEMGTPMELSKNGKFYQKILSLQTDIETEIKEELQ